MTNLNIDRLTLKLSGISESEGQRLIKLITEGLANSNIPNQAANLPHLKVNIPSRPNASIDWLAEQIIADVLRQLN